MSTNQIIFPGIGFFVGTSLIIFCIALLFIYLKTKNKAFLSTALFCGFTAPYAIEQFIVQLKLVTPITAFYYMCFVRVFYMLSLYYYGESMNDYISLPKQVMKPYRIAIFILLTFTLLAPLSYSLFGEPLVVDMVSRKMPENYFVNSYMILLGTPQPYMTIIQFFTTLVISAFSISILLNLKKQNIDPFLAAGIIFTLCAVSFEALTLSINIAYFVPVIFLSNFIEASRLTFLYIKKYLIDQEILIIEA